MEAIITRPASNYASAAASGWLNTIRRFGRAVLGAIGYVLVHYSRAAMLLRGEGRPFRRL